MATRKYPNRNGRFERRWYGEINRRWAKAWNEIKLLGAPTLIVNFQTVDEQRIELYIQRIREILAREILPASWQYDYIQDSYEQALKQTTQQIKPYFSQEEYAALLAVLALSIDSSEIHRNEFNFMRDEASISLVAALNNFMDGLPSLIRNNISRPANEIISLMRESFGRARKSARRNATTRINQVSQRAAILRSQEIEDTTGLQTELRWITQADSRVRHLHAGWHGRIMTREKALQNMSISPWNCRCGLQPLIANRVPARINAKFAKERKALLANQVK